MRLIIPSYRKILKESPGLSKNEYQQNNYYVNRQLQNTFIKSGGKDYRFFSMVIIIH